MRVPAASHSGRRLLLSGFQILVILIGVSSYCCFNLHFPDDVWRGATFHVHLYHPYVLRWGASKSLAHFFIGLFVCLLMSFENSFSILDTSSLLDMCFANIFFRSVVCFIPLTLSFAEQVFLILIQSHISIFIFHGSCVWRFI